MLDSTPKINSIYDLEMTCSNGHFPITMKRIHLPNGKCPLCRCHETIQEQIAIIDRLKDRLHRIFKTSVE